MVWDSGWGGICLMSNTDKNLTAHSNNILRRRSNSWNVQATVAVGNTYTEMGKVAYATSSEIRGIKLSETGEYLVTVDGIGAYRGHRLTPAFSVSNVVSQGATVLLSNVPFVRESVYFDFFNSGNSIYMLSEVTGVLTSTNLSNSYNILSAANSASYTAGNTWLRANTTTSTNVIATISSDGTDLLVSDNRANVLHYVLSQPGNLQTASLTYTWTPTLDSGETISDVTFGTDNANVYLTCKPPSNSFDVVIRQYSLATPKYINTASYVSNVVITTNTIPNYSSLHFGSDNGNVYLYIGSAAGSAYQIRRGFMPAYGAVASTVWTTANTIQKFSISGSKNHGISLSDTGDTVFINNVTGALFAYPLTTPWDTNTINTNPLVEQFMDLRYRMETIKSCSFFNNGKSVIVCEAIPVQPIVHKIELDTAWNIESHTKTVKDTGVLFTRSITDTTTITSFAIDSTGTNVYASGGVAINQFKLSTPWDLSTASYFANANTQIYTLSSLIQKTYDGNTFIYGTEAASNRIAQYSMASNGDIRTLSYLRTNTIPFSTSLSFPTFTFSSNNQYLYTSAHGSNFQPLIRYNYNSSSNVSNYSFDQSSTGRYSFLPDLTEFQWNTQKGMYITPDGRKLFIKATTYLYEYSLSTPWEVSTAAYVRKVIPPSSMGIGTLFYISPNGRRAHTVSGSTIYYATMATPWDITTFIEATASTRAMTAGALGSLSPIRGMRMDSSGSRMIIYGNSYLIGYSISDFDVSGASYVGESYYNASLGSSSVYDFDVSPSGRVIFLPYPTTTGIGIRKYTSNNPNAWRPNDFYTGLSSTKEIASAPFVGYGFYVDPTGNKAVLLDSNTASIYSYNIGG